MKVEYLTLFINIIDMIWNIRNNLVFDKKNIDN